MKFGRRFGIDFGVARIGIAICDPEGLVATPLTTLANDNNFWIEFRKLQNEYNATGVYLGNPKQLSGKSGTIESIVSDFAERVAIEIGLPVTMVDERLSSKAAENKLHEMGISEKESRGLVDQIAAAGILELGISLEKKNG